VFDNIELVVQVVVEACAIIGPIMALATRVALAQVLWRRTGNQQDCPAVRLQTLLEGPPGNGMVNLVGRVPTGQRPLFRTRTKRWVGDHHVGRPKRFFQSVAARNCKSQCLQCRRPVRIQLDRLRPSRVGAQQ